MHRRHGAAILGAATAAALGAALVAPVGSASADPAKPGRPAQSQTSPAASDHTEVGPDFNAGKKLPLDRAEVRSLRAQKQSREAAADPAVGDQKYWLTMDDYEGTIAPSEFTLRGIGDHIQVWVADDTAFPAGDCRNDLGMTDITNDQVDSFIHEFDSNIYPTESEAFSVPESLDGATAPLPEQLDLPADYYQVSSDQADDIVVLVDNVRDANYYDPTTPDGQTFIAGFFYSTFNYYADRNIMTIDANDWLHRTGATPPDDSQDPAYMACAAKQGYERGYGSPRPRDYEGTFAHEYQHLLESYQDPDEVSWVNEGLSDYAQSLVGYVNTNLPPTAPDADSHIGCFQGYLPESYGGAENSLTLWQDQGGPEVLCDYGAAYSFMMYLYSHYGEDFMSDLHTQRGNGLAGLAKTLRSHHAGRSAMQTVHDWEAMVALDSAIDRSHKVIGGNKKYLTSSSLKSSINWANPQSYSSPGAPPNGSDYVRLGTPGHWMSANKVERIAFNGGETLKPNPVEWTVDSTPPDATTADTTCGAVDAGTGPAALYAGCGADLDRSLVRSVKVPASGGQLSFQTLYDTEEGWDYGFAQISTNGGKTWKSLATADTTAAHDPGAIPGVVGNLPGFTGDSAGWKSETADLSAYHGKTVLLGFRYVTDGGVNEGGFWVRDIKVGSTELPASLSGWKTITQVRPQQVPGWTVQLVSIARNGDTWYHKLKLGQGFYGALSGKKLRAAIGNRATTVAAIVSMDDPSETVTQYGRYKLTVKGPQGYAGRH